MEPGVPDGEALGVGAVVAHGWGVKEEEEEALSVYSDRMRVQQRVSPPAA